MKALKRIKNIHFIGIGGIGMSALAYVLANKQLPVSGSDKYPNHITKRLESIGVNIFDRQEANNLLFFRSPTPTSTNIQLCAKHLISYGQHMIAMIAYTEHMHTCINNLYSNYNMYTHLYNTCTPS